MRTIERNRIEHVKLFVYPVAFEMHSKIVDSNTLQLVKPLIPTENIAVVMVMPFHPHRPRMEFWFSFNAIVLRLFTRLPHESVAYSVGEQKHRLRP